MSARSSARTETDKELAIYALHSIFTALEWIDDGALEGRACPYRIEEARANLVIAGKMLCDRTTARF